MLSVAEFQVGFLYVPAVKAIGQGPDSTTFNDEIHQETVAKMRNRAPENRWIGQRIDDPRVDLVAMARAQGFEGEDPVTTDG